MTQENRILTDQDLDVLFREARTFHGWQDKPLSDVLIQAVYDLMKWGPTSFNCCPARFVFVKSKQAKDRLMPHLNKGNQEQTMAAPVTAIIANDLKFHEHLPQLMPGKDVKRFFAGKPAAIAETAMRNGSLQGGYFIMAVRALGLDCGAMSGFNKDGVREEFFPGQDIEVNFLCNFGYGDPDSLRPRGPRFGFDEVCDIL